MDIHGCVHVTLAGGQERKHITEQLSVHRLVPHVTSQVPFIVGKVILCELALTVDLKDCISFQSIKIITVVLTSLLIPTFIASKIRHKTAERNLLRCCVFGVVL